MRISMQALTPAQVETIHEQTLELLWNHGIELNCEDARETFIKHGARVEGNQVYIPPKLVEDAVKSAPSRFTLHARDTKKTIEVGKGCRVAVLACSGIPNVVDESGKQHQATFDHYRDMLRMTQTSPVISVANSGSLYPASISSQHSLYLQMLLTLSMTDLPFLGQTEGRTVSKDCIEFARISTGINDKVVAVGICNSLSPMAWDKTMLEGIRAYAEEGQVTNISCCSLAGATGPIYLMGGILQANAEVLAGITYSQLVRTGAPVIYGTTSSVMDMRSMGLSLGTPEYSLISTGCSQMAAFYDVPFRGGGGLSDSKSVDAQAGIEAALNLMVSMNNGIDFMIQGIGVLEAYMSMSLSKWVMDEDIVLRIKRVQGGLGEYPEDLTQVIADGFEAGNYLGHESTMMEFRTELFQPMLADRRGYELWSADGKTYNDMANECVKRRLELYELPEIDSGAKRQIESIVEKRLGYSIADEIKAN